MEKAMPKAEERETGRNGTDRTGSGIWKKRAMMEMKVVIWQSGSGN